MRACATLNPCKPEPACSCTRALVMFLDPPGQEQGRLAWGDLAAEVGACMQGSHMCWAISEWLHGRILHVQL